MQSVVEAMEEDVSAGKTPEDDTLKNTLVTLRNNADFYVWARLANLSCSLPPFTTPPLVEDPPTERVTVASRSRALWSAVLDIMERNPEAAAQWEAGTVSDATLLRMLTGLTPNAPVHLVLRLVSVISTMIRGVGTGSESSRKGICSLQSAQGVWKRKSSYSTPAYGTLIYGAALSERYGRASIGAGVSMFV